MTGRPSDYTEEVGDEFCERVALGETIAKICKDEHMPAERTVYKWFRLHEAFGQNYARAKEESAHKSAELIREYSQQVLDGTLDPNAARVVIDAEKWIAGKRKPKVYGDRQILDVGDDTLAKLSDEQVNAKLADLLAKAGVAVALGGARAPEDGE